MSTGDQAATLTTTSKVPRVEAPPFYLQACESRALVEKARLPLLWPALVQAPRGDGHKVLVLPGFNTSDRSTRPLRRYLAALGYESHGWGLGRNLGPGRRAAAGMEELLSALTADGNRISVVGWSLGGLYAREMARDHPTSVRYVATLGSPFRMRDGDASTLSALLEKRFKKNFDAVEPPREEDRTEMSVPSSAIYSRTDGFVRPHLCIDESSPLHENIEVRGSHMGLVVNPAVYYALAHRLHAVSDGNLWTSFAAPTTARLAYPRPLSWNIAHRRPALRPVS